MFVKRLGCVKNGRQTHFCLLFLLVLIHLPGGVFHLRCTKVTPACESTVISVLFVQQLVSVKTSVEKVTAAWGEKAFQNSMVLLGLHRQFKADSEELNKLRSPGKGGRGFLLKSWRGRGISSPSWDPRLCPYPRDLESTHLPLKKPSCVEVLSSTEPSALSVGVKDSVSFPKWVYMSWQVSPTPFTFSIK